jgi:hypothetical protein
MTTSSMAGMTAAVSARRDGHSVAAASGHNHVPALDGIRGLAILLVLFFHFMLIAGNGVGHRLIQKTWGYGWAGVDLFFVLSGVPDHRHPAETPRPSVRRLGTSSRTSTRVARFESSRFTTRSSSCSC